MKWNVTEINGSSITVSGLNSSMRCQMTFWHQDWDSAATTWICYAISATRQHYCITFGEENPLQSPYRNGSDFWLSDVGMEQGQSGRITSLSWGNVQCHSIFGIRHKSDVNTHQEPTLSPNGRKGFSVRNLYTEVKCNTREGICNPSSFSPFPYPGTQPLLNNVEKFYPYEWQQLIHHAAQLTSSTLVFCSRKASPEHWQIWWQLQSEFSDIRELKLLESRHTNASGKTTGFRFLHGSTRWNSGASEASI